MIFINKINKITADEITHIHDAIVVLTGGANRINTGLDLLAENRAPVLFISGTDERVTTEELIEIWGKGDPAKPLCCIVLGHNAKDTKGNAAESYEWIKEHNIGSIILVTAYYHMPRSQIEFAGLLGDIKIQPYPVGYYGKNKLGFTDWLLLTGEYNKYMWVSAFSKF